MHTTIEKITPAKAAQYLATMTSRQRPLRQSWVKSLASFISEGAFHETHQGIAFNRDGELIDGQHRLSAVIMAGLPISVPVVRGVDSNAWHAIDIGFKRTHADITGIDKKTIEVLRWALVILKGKPAISAETLLSAEQSKLGKSIVTLRDYCNTAAQVFSSAPVKLGACLQFCNTQDEYVLEQYRALVLQQFDKMSVTSQSFFRQKNANILSQRVDLTCRAYRTFDPSTKSLEKIVIKHQPTIFAEVKSDINRLINY